MENSVLWDKWKKEMGEDPYGEYCVQTAERIMAKLDEGNDFDIAGLLHEADVQNILTPLMIGNIVRIVTLCHARGDEFLAAWQFIKRCPYESPDTFKMENGKSRKVVIKDNRDLKQFLRMIDNNPKYCDLNGRCQFYVPISGGNRECIFK